MKTFIVRLVGGGIGPVGEVKIKAKAFRVLFEGKMVIFDGEDGYIAAFPVERIVSVIEQTSAPAP